MCHFFHRWLILSLSEGGLKPPLHSKSHAVMVVAACITVATQRRPPLGTGVQGESSMRRRNWKHMHVTINIPGGLIRNIVPCTRSHDSCTTGLLRITQDYGVHVNAMKKINTLGLNPASRLFCRCSSVAEFTKENTSQKIKSDLFSFLCVAAGIRYSPKLLPAKC